MNENNASIKKWSPQDRPREKLELNGKEYLTDAELLAILLVSGSKKESALSLARRILATIPDLHELGKKDLDFFTAFRGIGKAKGIGLIAALELGRRRQIINPESKSSVTSSEDAFKVIGPLIRDLPHEEFWIACLNRRNKLISKERISVGGISATVVDPKIIFKTALSSRASSIILFHNHPSGGITPSKEDERITRKLVGAGELLEIKVLDHLIIGDNSYYSFADEGKI